MSQDHLDATASSCNERYRMRRARTQPAGLRRIRRRRGRRRAGRHRGQRERGAPRRAHAAGGALRLPRRHGHGRRRDQLRRSLRQAQRRDARSWCTAWSTSCSRASTRWAASTSRRTACRAASACAPTTSRSTSARPTSCCCDAGVRAAVPRLGRGGRAWTARASRRWWSRPSPAARRSAPTPSSTAAAMPTWRPSPACPSRSATAMAAGSFPSTMFRVGHVDAPRALAAVGEFKAINDLMAKAREREPERLRLPARRRDPAAADRPARMARQRHADPQCPGQGDERRRRARAERRRGRGPAPDRRVLPLPEGRGAGLRAFGHRRDRAAGRHPRDAAHRGPLRADRRGHPVVGALRRQHRHQRLADGDARRRQDRMGASRATRRAPTTSCPGACWCRAASTTCWWPAAAPR